MANGRLLPCPSCARHVRSSESACPFCATALAAAPAGEPSTPVASKRLSRAALFALGASAAAIAACSSQAIYGAPAVDDGGADAQPQPTPAYGGPPIDASVDGPLLVDAAYGGPPQDASDASDAADDAETGAAPAYGAPP